MRLIDADKLMLSLADWKLQESPISTYPKPKEFTADDMQRMIWRTIRDCESAVEEQPTVKAIPIEWIKKKSLEFLTNRNFRWATDFQEVIDMWKVENNIPLFDDELKITLEKENQSLE